MKAYLDYTQPGCCPSPHRTQLALILVVDYCYTQCNFPQFTATHLHAFTFIKLPVDKRTANLLIVAVICIVFDQYLLKDNMYKQPSLDLDHNPIPKPPDTNFQKNGEKNSPISVILVSSGSRGNKLLFRYPFVRVSENTSSTACKCPAQTVSFFLFCLFVLGLPLCFRVIVQCKCVYFLFCHVWATVTQ